MVADPSGLSNTYLDWARTRGPRWLRGIVDGFGDRWQQAFGVVADAISGGARSAARVRYPSTTPDDGVPYIAAERRLEQYPPETLEAWRERVGRAWSQWYKGGRPSSMVDQLTRYGVQSVTVLEHWVSAVTPGMGNARFVIVLGDGVSAASLPWLHSVLGGWVLGPDTTMGSTATPTEVRAVRAIVLKWHSSHSYPVAVLLRFVGGVIGTPFWPRDPANDVSAWILGNATLSIGLATLPWDVVGYRSYGT